MSTHELVTHNNALHPTPAARLSLSGRLVILPLLRVSYGIGPQGVGVRSGGSKKKFASKKEVGAHLQ